MAVGIGSYDAILSGGVGGNGGVTDPLPDNTEGVTRGHWTGLDLATFPPVWATPPAGWDGTNVLPIEPLYPIIPERKSNNLTFRTDNKAWKNVQKAENPWGHELNRLSYRIVRADYMLDVYDFIKLYKGQTVTLSTPGVQPFMRTSETNQVYIKDITKPKRIRPNTYTIDIVFLFDPNQ